MQLPFLNRSLEIARIQKALQRTRTSLVVLYGRRRCGKSRLLVEASADLECVYFVGDDRHQTLQRRALAVEIGRALPGFAEVEYPDWETLFRQWWHRSRPGSVLILDEFPSMVARAPEIPSLLQKCIDDPRHGAHHLIVAGSSQRMMMGLALDSHAPLYGRAREILEIGPLDPPWILKALAIQEPEQALDPFSVWGGVPRYWELAREYGSTTEALRELILDPLGVLHREPERLLLDDMRDVVQAFSVLSLVGVGCHRISELGSRLGRQTTSLSRPLERLIELGLVDRVPPFGTPDRGSGRSEYRISDPFLRFWFRFVEPNRSRLQARQIDAVWTEVRQEMKGPERG
ncbi:MAG: ATP-binding protein [Candidatus Riflebacteria bacterium]|nr:ATP-binding protein [Candidatus Riflebacteria bacterium]